MLLVIRRPPSRFLSPVVQCRTFSKLSRKYHPNVTVVPFQRSKEDVIREIAPYVSINARGENIYGSALSHFLPSVAALVDAPIFRPSRMTPVYYPGWIVDGLLAGDVTVDGAVQGAKLAFSNSYIPGCVFPPISRVSMAFSELLGIETVPFTEDIEKLDGEDVTCLPFTISPLAIPKLVTSITAEDARLNNSVHVDPKSLKFDMLASYPVLFPLYLAQYEYDHPEKGRCTISVCVDGVSGKHGLIENVDLQPEEAFQVSSWSSGPPFLIIDDLIGSTKALGIKAYVNAVVNTFMGSRQAADILAEQCSLNMDHASVRRYTSEEIVANRSWVKMGMELRRWQGIAPEATLSKMEADYVKAKPEWIDRT